MSIDLKQLKYFLAVAEEKVSAAPPSACTFRSRR
jgi:hypothetical protein